MNVLVTGGSGFIGSAVLEELVQKNDFNVVAIQHNSPVEASSRLTIIKGGLHSINQRLLENYSIDVIVHLARPTFPKLRSLGRLLAGLIGKVLNQRLVKLIDTKFPDVKLIYISGSLMYGNSDRPHTEESTLNPISYARDYARVEEPIIKWSHKSDKVLIARVPWVLGKGSWFEWIYKAHLANHMTLPKFGNGENKMHFILRSSLASWIVNEGMNPSTRGIRNVFGNDILTQNQWLVLLKENLQATIESTQVRYEQAIKEAFTSSIVLQSKYELELTKPTIQTEIKDLCNWLSEKK